MLLLPPHLRLLHQQRKQLHKAIQELLNQIGQDQGDRCQHRNLVAATMLAEASRALAQRDYHALRSYGGLAPVTRQSGKSKVVLHAPGLQFARAQRSLSLGARQYPT
jgi:transposase